jgi:hypothetical protein
MEGCPEQAVLAMRGITGAAAAAWGGGITPAFPARVRAVLMPEQAGLIIIDAAANSSGSTEREVIRCTPWGWWEPPVSSVLKWWKFFRSDPFP